MDQQRYDSLIAEAQEVAKEVKDAQVAWLADPENRARKQIFDYLVARQMRLDNRRLAGERQRVLQLHISMHAHTCVLACMHVRTMQPQIPEQELACNVHFVVFHARQARVITCLGGFIRRCVWLWGAHAFNVAVLHAAAQKCLCCPCCYQRLRQLPTAVTWTATTACNHSPALM